MIPKEWLPLRLGDIADFRKGKGLSKADLVPDGSRRCVHYGELFTMYGERIDTVVSGTNREGSFLYSEPNDVLMPTSDVTPNGLATASCITIPGVILGGDILVIRALSRTLNGVFLAYCIRMNRDQIMRLVSGTTVFHLYARDMANFVLGVPGLEEQLAIVSVLGDVEAEVAAMDELIAKKRDIKQAAMQQLLTGKKRLPGFTGEWETRKLLDLVDGRKELFDDGDWIEAEYITESGVRLVQTGNIGVGAFEEREGKKYISEESFARLRCKELHAGDLLICRLGEPAGRACVLPDLNERRVITAVDVAICRPPDDVADRQYLCQLFSTRWWFEKVAERCGGSTRSRIARGELGRIELRLPPREEQKAVASVLSDMDAEVAALERRRDKMKAIKQGMMQELLTGRIRLVEPGAHR